MALWCCRMAVQAAEPSPTGHTCSRSVNKTPLGVWLLIGRKHRHICRVKRAEITAPLPSTLTSLSEVFAQPALLPVFSIFCYKGTVWYGWMGSTYLKWSLVINYLCNTVKNATFNTTCNTDKDGNYNIMIILLLDAKNFSASMISGVGTRLWQDVCCPIRWSC